VGTRCQASIIRSGYRLASQTLFWIREKVGPPTRTSGLHVNFGKFSMAVPAGCETFHCGVPE
jgi:hypothetical protein